MYSCVFFLPYQIPGIDCINLICRYVEEHVQKTGVAIETQGFTFVTSGRKRESLTVGDLHFHFVMLCFDTECLSNTAFY